jgi:hypothetical protein
MGYVHSLRKKVQKRAALAMVICCDLSGYSCGNFFNFGVGAHITIGCTG